MSDNARVTSRRLCIDKLITNFEFLVKPSLFLLLYSVPHTSHATNIALRYMVYLLCELREYSGSFEDVSSNTVICFQGIPKEFRGNMTVLLEISDKDPLY